jgi:hypothetical protein
MSETRGGKNKRKRFGWEYDPRTMRILIENEDGRRHEFPVQEIEGILRHLQAKFGNAFFPLANNVVKLTNGTERPGLGTKILEQKPGDIHHAQGASYLGVVMEECRYFEWNRKRRGIMWRLIDSDFSIQTIITKLQNVRRRNSSQLAIVADSASHALSRAAEP